MSLPRIAVKPKGCTITMTFRGKLCRINLTKNGTYAYEGSKASEQHVCKHAQKALTAKLPDTDSLTLYLKEWSKPIMQLIDYHRMLGDILRINFRT